MVTPAASSSSAPILNRIQAGTPLNNKVRAGSINVLDLCTSFIGAGLSVSEFFKNNKNNHNNNSLIIGSKIRNVKGSGGTNPVDKNSALNNENSRENVNGVELVLKKTFRNEGYLASIRLTKTEDSRSLLADEKSENTIRSLAIFSNAMLTKSVPLNALQLQTYPLPPTPMVQENCNVRLAKHVSLINQLALKDDTPVLSPPTSSVSAKVNASVSNGGQPANAAATVESPNPMQRFEGYSFPYQDPLFHTVGLRGNDTPVHLRVRHSPEADGSGPVAADSNNRKVHIYAPDNSSKPEVFSDKNALRERVVQSNHADDLKSSPGPLFNSDGTAGTSKLTTWYYTYDEQNQLTPTDLAHSPHKEEIPSKVGDGSSWGRGAATAVRKFISVPLQAIFEGIKSFFRS